MIKTEQELLAKYKEFDSLNKDKENPFVKIMVSYIKPAFLFKSDILMPIHLGRVVEQADSKDGVQSSENLKWLHENCDFNDDFEGGISKHNRRLGFLTGTYWAWKNYEKLGNPVYFGSLGYRKLLYPDFLDSLEKFDVILPCKATFDCTLKKQFIDWHGQKYYDMMMDVMQKLYPDELDLMDDYMCQFSGYYAEMYVMKKDLFFEFCDWIFKVVDYLLHTYPDFVKSEGHVGEKLENLVSGFVGKMTEEQQNKIGCANNEKRDLAFILERLSGYYLYKLTKRSHLKYREIKMFEHIVKNPQKAANYKNMVLAQMRKNVLRRQTS